MSAVWNVPKHSGHSGHSGPNSAFSTRQQGPSPASPTSPTSPSGKAQATNRPSRADSEQMWTDVNRWWKFMELMDTYGTWTSHIQGCLRFLAVVAFIRLLYGFYTAFIRLLASSPFGIVLARWFLRLLGFCSFLLLTLYACFSARNWHMISTSVLTGPFSSPENRISGHLLKFVLQPYLKENHVKIDEHHRKKWGKTM